MDYLRTAGQLHMECIDLATKCLTYTNTAKAEGTCLVRVLSSCIKILIMTIAITMTLNVTVTLTIIATTTMTMTISMTVIVIMVMITFMFVVVTFNCQLPDADWCRLVHCSFLSHS